jgi:hypothetical protein
MKLPRIAIVATVAVLAAAAILAIGGGLATAHIKKYGSTVTINFQEGGAYADQFRGKVRSNKAACKKQRTVKVYRKKPGPDALYGSDKTNKKGKYVVAPGRNATPGNYYAKAKKRVLKKNSLHKHVCKKATSNTIPVP